MSFILFALISCLSKTTYGQNHCKEVIGYYPGWQWYDRNKLVNPESIEYSKYTILNYAFLYPLADGTITLTDPWSDKNLLLGTINWSASPAGYDSSYDLGNPAYHVPNTSLIYHAHSNNTKVMISLGGWTLSDDFSSIAANPTKRSNFAHSCNELIRIYDIDGVDIDWEYPGYVAHNGTPNDITNYTLLLQEIRDSLDFVEVELGKNLMLTSAFGADPDRMDDVDWDEVIPLLDYINLMSYDFFGAFSAETNHNSPLYAPISGNQDFNCHSAVERLITQYNVPADKLNLGVAFYGRSVKTNGAAVLHGPTTGVTDLITFAVDEGSPQYYNILDDMSLFDEHWDDDAKVPYLTGIGNLNTFLSYDNEKSIGLKGQYIVDKNLAGAIIWEITGDYIETSPGSGIISGTPLVDTLNLALCHLPTLDTNTTDNSNVGINMNDNSMFEIYPNPTSGNVYITSNSEAITRIYITTITGELVLVSNKLVDQVDLTKMNPGIYFMNVESDEKVKTYKIIKQ
jgi:chitinase